MARFVILEGNIGAGKTTMINTYTNINESFMIGILEDLDSDDLKNFYDDPQSNASSFQFKIISHIKKKFDLIIENPIDRTKNILFDRFLPGTLSFSIANWSLGLIDDVSLEKLFMIIQKNMNYTFKKIQELTNLPPLMLYLHTDVNQCYNRIKIRGRKIEADIQLDYLENIEKSYKFVLIYLYLKFKLRPLIIYDNNSRHIEYIEKMCKDNTNYHITLDKKFKELSIIDKFMRELSQHIENDDILSMISLFHKQDDSFIKELIEFIKI